MFQDLCGITVDPSNRNHASAVLGEKPKLGLSPPLSPAISGDFQYDLNQLDWTLLPSESIAGQRPVSGVCLPENTD